MLAALPAVSSTAGGQSTRHRRSPSTPLVPSDARRTSAPACRSSATTRSSEGRPTGPTSAVSTSPAIADTAPTWSRSKCVRTSRSSRSTPSRSRQARSCSGSSPVSTSAVRPALRTSVASPCPTSHIATVQPVGTVARATTSGTATAPTPTRPTRTAPTVSDRRNRLPTSTAVASAELTAVAATTPTVPAGHGAAATGRSAATCAAAPMAAAGPHPTAASTPAPPDQTGARRQDASPATVTTGASISANRFVGTAYVGSAGDSGIVTGQHAVCAATGTATAAATGVQNRRASRSVSGGARTTMPVVASTESAKANDRAVHGSATIMPTTARAINGTPRTGRPVRCTTRTTTAITVARVIDGSGRTSTTKPSSTAIATTTRRTRGAPTARPSNTTSATSTAQFEPDTAVRCVSAEVSIACSVAGSSPDRSPIARPRSSAAPGSGRSAVTATNAARASALQPNTPCGPATTSVGPRVKWTNAVAAPGSSASSWPRTRTTDPAGSTEVRGASDAGTSRTGTRRPA